MAKNWNPTSVGLKRYLSNLYNMATGPCSINVFEHYAVWLVLMRNLTTYWKTSLLRLETNLNQSKHLRKQWLQWCLFLYSIDDEVKKLIIIICSRNTTLFMILRSLRFLNMLLTIFFSPEMFNKTGLAKKKVKFLFLVIHKL